MHPLFKSIILVAFAFEVFIAVYVGIDIELGKLLTQNKKEFNIYPTIDISPIKHQTKQPPTAIKIERINKNLPIQAALVDGNKWDMFPQSVAWLSTSAVPGEGNVILYAHNWPSLWRDLYKLERGDIIQIQQNHLWLTYFVTESRAVTPNDIQAVLGTENQLTLYTCEGSFDQKRRVVYAIPGY